MQLAELVEVLVLAGKNVLIIDACLLLDVIQAPTRDKLRIVEFAMKIDAMIQANALPFSIVLPYLFQNEWNANVQRVCSEVSKDLNKHKELTQVYDNLHSLLFGNPLSDLDLTTYLFEASLEQLCRRIIAAAHRIEKQDVFAIRAFDRVEAGRAPARRGKSEPEDCRNFEEAIGLGKELRQQGFVKKIIFASSNTSDYGNTSNPLPDIKDDLNSINAEFAASLEYAFHLASS